MIEKYYSGSSEPPVIEEIRPVLVTDENGVEHVQFLKFDYSSLKNGRIFDWSFDALAKAGINPPVMGTFCTENTNLQSSQVLDVFSSNLDTLTSNIE